MKRWALGAVTLFGIMFLAAVAGAQTDMLPDAKAAWWGKQAVEFFKTQGQDKALAEFSNPQGKFARTDGFIYVLDLDGKMLAHPKSELVGKDFMTMKDAEGKLYFQEIVKLAKAQGSGWLEYKGENPKTNQVEPVSAYYDKVDGVIIISAASKT